MLRHSLEGTFELLYVLCELDLLVLLFDAELLDRRELHQLGALLRDHDVILKIEFFIDERRCNNRALFIFVVATGISSFFLRGRLLLDDVKKFDLLLFFSS